MNRETGTRLLTNRTWMIICIIYVIFSLPGCIGEIVLQPILDAYQKYKLEDPKGMAEAQEEAINSLDGS